jgi:hypothetical protein
LDISLKKGETIITTPDGDVMILANIDHPALIGPEDFILTML